MLHLPPQTVSELLQERIAHFPVSVIYMFHILNLI